jgi:hypothetical protein
MMKSAVAIIILGAVAVAAQFLAPRRSFRATVTTMENTGAEPGFAFRFAKSAGHKLRIERVMVRLVDAPVSGYCGFGDSSLNRLEHGSHTDVMTAVPTRSKGSEWQSDTIESLEPVVVDNEDSFSIHVSGRCGEATAKATVSGVYFN